MARDYPVGKAQQMVLDALGMKASGHNDAKEKFAKIGIVVGSRREGRSSVPVVTVKDRIGGAFGPGGDGESFRQYDDIDVAPIQQWIEER